MSAAALLDDLRRHGASVRLSGGAVRLSIPPGSRLPESLVNAARAAKAELAALLSAGTNPSRMDLAEPEERAALVQYDGEVPAMYADTFARIQHACPNAVPEVRWRQFIHDGGLFLDQWGRMATESGWTAPDLFGLHETKPLVRHDATGLLWLLKGEQVVALDSIAARLSGGLTYRRAVLPTVVAVSGQ